MHGIILGKGEIGRALSSIFNEISFDKHDKPLYAGDKKIDILHICFPYSENFLEEVKKYQGFYEPTYTIIHSTVPVGTSRKAGAMHSPIRGMHPYLEGGIRTFVKFIGGEQASEVADYFRRVGIRIALFDKSETTEAMKLFDTEYYRVCIEFCHRVKKYCDEHNLNFSDVYRVANTSYNEGYFRLGHPEFIRPVLEPIMTPIGGHCVLQNKDLIDG